MRIISWPWMCGPLCKRLGLILPNGQLSEEAQSLARLSDLPKYYRNDMDYPAVSRLLARQIVEQFRGVNGLSIVKLLQDCARALKNSDSAWIALCPGLLLVEVQYLIEIAHTDYDLAQQQEIQLVAHRDSIMQDIDMSAPTADNELDAYARSCGCSYPVLLDRVTTNWAARHDPDGVTSDDDAVNLRLVARRLVSGGAGAMPGRARVGMK